jgi:hypothetical protein
MGALTRDTIVHLLGGETLTARRQASRPAHRAWVGVVSLEQPRRVFLNTADELLLGRLLVRSFEVSENILDEGYDIHEEDLAESQRFNVTGSRELLDVLSRLGVSPDTLDFKLVTGYP